SGSTGSKKEEQKMSAPDLRVVGTADGDVLFEQLTKAAARGLAPNFVDWSRLTNHREGDIIELQALHGAAGRAEINKFAHATSPEVAIALLEKAERLCCPGLYAIGNRVDPAVATQAVVDE